jgi:hypothetical protein
MSDWEIFGNKHKERAITQPLEPLKIETGGVASETRTQLLWISTRPSFLLKENQSPIITGPIIHFHHA